MPHVVILYTPDLEAASDMSALCRSLADAMLTVRDETGTQVFPTGGVRVLAYPAAHSAVADGSGKGSGVHGFCWINLRMGRSRSAATQQAIGQVLTDAAKRHFAPVLATRHLGLTLQVDEGPEVFDAKFGNLHPLFSKS